ncbi:VOC family protein [Sneathiella chinensis]|uniref:VOC domain-containing protein n=1 Tax=Sneathiella chinensis TaxID=349750 RepID=A0ABQ5U656_9PROT|nr:VOC family protein [Sneathiella chinensis]GLQ07261.1 hypothetical protein GCM10007924_24820 [Sneathiella chinensis]
MTVDIGLTHVALAATHLDDSIRFYHKYARMQVIHQRTDPVSGHRVVWLSDRTRPFVLVLIEAESPEPVLTPFAHLGVGCATRREVDQLAEEARKDGILIREPVDEGYPVGYYIFVKDPNGHSLELSYGQEVGLAVEEAN